jgi:hypothetical protein
MIFVATSTRRTASSTSWNGRAELTTIIGCDEAVRKNALRHRQLSSIGEQLVIARGRRLSIARMIEQLKARS